MEIELIELLQHQEIASDAGQCYSKGNLSYYLMEGNEQTLF